MAKAVKKDLGPLLGQYVMEIYETETREEAVALANRLLDLEADGNIPDIKPLIRPDGGYSLVVTSFVQKV